MADIKDTDIPIDAWVTAGPESADPAYLEWKRQKIEAALKAADEHPDRVRSEKEIWKKFGLAY